MADIDLDVQDDQIVAVDDQPVFEFDVWNLISGDDLLVAEGQDLGLDALFESTALDSVGVYEGVTFADEVINLVVDNLVTIAEWAQNNYEAMKANRVLTEVVGVHKLVVITCAPNSTAERVILTLAEHKISEIDAILSAELIEGNSANLATVSATADGLEIRVETFNAAGGPATNWTNALVRLTLLGH